MGVNKKLLRACFLAFLVSLSVGSVLLIFNVLNFFILLVLLQHGADPNIRNTDGKTALDVAEASAKLVLTGIYDNIALHLSQAFNN